MLGLLTFVADTVDDAVAVVADQQRAVLRKSDVHGSAPNVLLAGREADDKVLIFTCRLAILKRKADDLVARMKLAVPGAVQRDESISLPRSGEMTSLVKGW